MRAPFLWIALVCFALAILSNLDPSILGTGDHPWGWGGLASLVVHQLSGGYVFHGRAGPVA